MAGADCERALREIEAYLDGELDPAQAGSLHEHLAACSPCMDHADFKRKIKDLIKATCRCTEEDLPDSLRVRIEAAWVEIRSSGPGSAAGAE